MIVLECIVILAVLFSAIYVASIIITEVSYQKTLKREAELAKERQMYDDLAEALKSRDSRELDVWIAAHSHDAPRTMVDNVMTRRNELRIDERSE